MESIIKTTSSLEELRREREIVRVFVRKYRKELTVFGAAALTGMNQFLEKDPQQDIDTYVSFVNDLSFDELVGDQLKALWMQDMMKIIEDIVLGRENFEYLVEASKVDIETYRKLMTKY